MAANTILQLQQPVTAGAIRSVNFFNGRLLTSKDLTREQSARHEAERQLGLALGEGVAFGLEVSFDKVLSKASLPVADVAQGLAFNRKGQALRVSSDVAVALTRQFEASPAADRLFVNCTVLGGGTYVAGAGLYVLTLAPAAATEGKAPTNGLDPTNVRCNTDTIVEAVQFRLIQVKRSLFPDLDVGAPSFRNAIAYRCFGAGAEASWFTDLLGAGPRQDDLVEALRQNAVSDVEVPLALLFFTGAADLQFIDLWSVRRPVAPRETGSGFESLASQHRLALGQAMFLQFQGQVADLAPPNGDLGSFTARGNFRFLPPAGVIPVAEETDSTDAQATKFFKDMTYRGPAFIDAARIEGLLRESFAIRRSTPKAARWFGSTGFEKIAKRSTSRWACRAHARTSFSRAGISPIAATPSSISVTSTTPIMR